MEEFVLETGELLRATVQTASAKPSIWARATAEGSHSQKATMKLRWRQ
jgi:hypothetical protein